MAGWIKSKDLASIEKHFRVVLEGKIGDRWLPGFRTVFEEEQLN